MKIGIGLPSASPRVTGALILDWARQAERGPFASLGVIDRLVYDSYEPLITLAAVAGATSRIRLMTTVLLAPLRAPGMLVKQCASLDALSGGRLTLGLGVGAREDDFRAAPADFRNRGKRLDEELELMSRTWSDQLAAPERIGPAPHQAGGPEILFGGYSPSAMRRLSRWGHGFISGGAAPEQASQFYRMATEAWQRAGRPGKPRLVGCTYYGLGPHASEGINSYISSYYTFLGAAVPQMIKNIPSTPEALRATIQKFAEIGADELVLWPSIAELDQAKRLTDIVGSMPTLTGSSASR